MEKKKKKKKKQKKKKKTLLAIKLKRLIFQPLCVYFKVCRILFYFLRYII
ncbi:hypothetical protein X975_16774, partial [Stegodyphus mimosarum]